MINAIRNISRPAKVIIGIGLVIVVFWLLGPLRSDRGVNVSQETALSIARDQVDFVPTHQAVRLIRQGFDNQPVWAVQLAIPIEGTDRQFHELTIVEVDATTGEVIRLRAQPEPEP